MAVTEEERGPERTCIVTRRKGAPETMIRFVVGPDATLVPDVRRKLPGRGVWVSAEEPTVAEAARKGAFARALKAKVTVSATLAMANKAGAVVAGFAKVEAAIGAGEVAAVLHATEAAQDGVRKIETLLRRGGGRSGPPLAIKLFEAEQLELALGRTNVIHVALAAGPASQAVLTRCHRLIHYRSGAAHDQGADATVASA